MKIALKIVGIIGLLFWTACCFLGLYFATDRKLMIAIPVTLLIAVALFLSYLILLKLQDKSAIQGNRDRAKVTSIIMLCVYAVATLVSAFYVNHVINTIGYKEEIRNKVKPALAELELTFDMVCEDTSCYSNKQGSYLKWVQATAESYKFHLKTVGAAGNIDTQVSKFKDKLLGNDIGSSYDFKSLVDIVIGDQDNPGAVPNIRNIVVDRWWLPTLLQRLEELQNEKEGWESKVTALSQRDDYAKTDHAFQLQSEHNYKDLTVPFTQASFKVSIYAILIMLALQIIILLGYLLCLKTGGKNDKIVTDDHGSTRSWSSGR